MIAVNLGIGTPKDAGELVEYCTAILNLALL
jgi:alpha-L-arabinofuranosidase